MKFEIKSLAVAAALLAAGAANAAVACNNGTVNAKVGVALTLCDPGGSGRSAELNVVSGGGALAFSNGGIDNTTGKLISNGKAPTNIGGLVAALNVGKVTLNPLDGALVTSKDVVKANGTSARGIVTIGATVNTLVANGTTGQIENVYATGGAEQVAAPLLDVLDGGTMSVRNLRFDLVNHAIYADLIGQSIDPATGLKNAAETAPGLKLWTYDPATSTGPTILDPKNLLAAAGGNILPMQQAGYVLEKQEPGRIPGFIKYTVSAHDVFNDLKVTDEGFAFFARSLGLGVVDPDTNLGGLGYETLKGVNAKVGGWGSITSDIVFEVQEVPEPSTYALMGLGLVGISLVARRRAK